MNKLLPKILVFRKHNWLNKYSSTKHSEEKEWMGFLCSSKSTKYTLYFHKDFWCSLSFRYIYCIFFIFLWCFLYFPFPGSCFKGEKLSIILLDKNYLQFPEFHMNLLCNTWYGSSRRLEFSYQKQNKDCFSSNTHHSIAASQTQFLWKIQEKIAKNSFWWQ